MPSPPVAPVPEDAALAPAVAPAPRKARFWDRIAVKYAADPIADMAGYELTLRRVQNLLSTDKAVLEIGCGTGTTALRLAPFTRRLLATDLSAGMIAIAHEKLAAQPVPQLSFAVADADAPVAGAGEYDLVLAFNLLHLVADLAHPMPTSASSSARAWARERFFSKSASQTTKPSSGSSEASRRRRSGATFLIPEMCRP